MFLLLRQWSAGRRLKTKLPVTLGYGQFLFLQEYYFLHDTNSINPALTFGLYSKQNLDYIENGNTDEVLKFALGKLNIVNLKLARV